MIVSKNQLQYLLGFSFKNLISICQNIDNYYYSFQQKKVKKDGTIKFRNIEPSKGKLKIIQKRIADNILSEIPLLPNVHGSVKGKSTITNVIPHLGKKFHFCTDLKSYYPSISHKLVFSTFRNYGFSTDISYVLTRLTTYRGSLPQGTPSSPIIANLVFEPADRSIVSFCLDNEIVYTRFVDDLVFSSQKDFKSKTHDLLKIILQSRFKISHPKTFYKIGPVEITGILVKHNILDLTNEMKEKDLSVLNMESRIGYENYFRQIKNHRKYKS